MKTLIAILGLIIGTSMMMNAQTQSQAQAKPSTTVHATSQPSTHQVAQAPAPNASQTKSMLKISELLKPIQENLATQFKGWTPVQAYKLDTKGVISYEVMVKKEANEMRLMYDNAGKFLRQEPVAAAASHSTSTTPPAKTTGKPK